MSGHQALLWTHYSRWSLLSPLPHVQGYFYWWVIVSIVWGLIAACIAIVMPVWEVRPRVRCLHTCLMLSMSVLGSPLGLVAWH